MHGSRLWNNDGLMLVGVSNLRSHALSAVTWRSAGSKPDAALRISPPDPWARPPPGPPLLPVAGGTYVQGHCAGSAHAHGLHPILDVRQLKGRLAHLRPRAGERCIGKEEKLVGEGGCNFW